MFASRQLDGRAREADERGVRQRVAHVPCEAVDEVVLAAVRLVGDDDDVAPLRQRGVRVAPVLRVEFLDRGEHHAARGDRQLLAQVGAALGLRRRLSEQVLAAREGAEELVVEVVAVREDDDGRVLHRRLARDRAGVEGHRTGSCPCPACARRRRCGGRRGSPPGPLANAS